jgi:hypothetical protein
MVTTGTSRLHRIWRIIRIYSSSLDKLLYGISQGSCASPILWALLYQLLLAALGDKFYFIQLFAVGGVEEYMRPVDSFVGDTTCGATNEDPDIDLAGSKYSS